MKNTHKLYTDVIAKSGYTTTGLKDFLEHGGRFSYTDYTDLTQILKYSDTENLTSMSNMFQSCYNLSSIPLLNTSKVTDMKNMFELCQHLTTISKLDTSNVTSMSYMFQNCYNLTTIPQLDTSNVEYMGYMFFYCKNLTTIPQLDVSKVTNMKDIFYNCNKLEQIHMTGMKVNFNISASTLFTRDALLEILNNLATVTTTRTLTMGSTNLAKLTDEDKSIATNKGWTLA